MFISPDYSPNVLNQMEKTDALLLKLKDILNKPLVAGGAPRDWFFNLRAKDVDIFVDPQDIPSLVEALNTLDIINVSAQLSEDLDESYRSPYISGVLSFLFEQIAFQIIVKNTTENVLLHFPASIVCITYENFCIKPTPIFLKSIRSSSMLITKSCNQKYERKIIQKFNAYSIQYVTQFRIDNIVRDTLIPTADNW